MDRARPSSPRTVPADDQETGARRDAEGLRRVEPMYPGARDGHPLSPQAAQELPRHRFLAQDGECSGSFVEPFELLEQHGFRDVEVALAGDGVDSPLVAEPSFRSGDGASQSAEGRARDPGRIPDDQEGFGQIGEDSFPVQRETVAAHEPRPLAPPRRLDAFPADAQMSLVDVRPDQRSRPGEDPGGRLDEIAPAAGGLDDRRRVGDERRQEADRGFREGERGLEVAVGAPTVSPRRHLSAGGQGAPQGNPSSKRWGTPSSGRMRGAFPTGWRPVSLARSVPPSFAGRENPPRRRFAPRRRARDIFHSPCDPDDAAEPPGPLENAPELQPPLQRIGDRQAATLRWTSKHFLRRRVIHGQVPLREAGDEVVGVPVVPRKSRGSRGRPEVHGVFPLRKHGSGDRYPGGSRRVIVGLLVHQDQQPVSQAVDRLAGGPEDCAAADSSPSGPLRGRGNRVPTPRDPVRR